MNRVLIKCWQPAKNNYGFLEVWAIYFFVKYTRVKWECGSLELPSALNYQAAYFHIQAVYLKMQREPWWKIGLKIIFTFCS